MCDDDADVLFASSNENNKRTRMLIWQKQRSISFVLAAVRALASLDGHLAIELSAFGLALDGTRGVRRRPRTTVER